MNSVYIIHDNQYFAHGTTVLLAPMKEIIIPPKDLRSLRLRTRQWTTASIRLAFNSRLNSNVARWQWINPQRSLALSDVADTLLKSGAFFMCKAGI